MAKKTTFTFTAPDGTTLKCTSDTKTYTHAILHKRNGEWKLASRVGRPDLVAQRLEEWGRGSPDVVAVPVNS